MSEIFLATQSGLAGFNKLVVLKTILPDISGEEDFVRMFLDEARTTAAFNHPNIAQVYELDVADGQLFMAMEFVQGCTLVEMARACRVAKEPIPVGFTLQAIRDTALALYYAHNFTDARGRQQVVIHRDVAEKNIMVTYEGVTKLLDFGIAKALGRSNRTNIGMVKGTSGYMSPEQIRGEPLDGRSDIFALGVVLHECLTGMRLFHGKKPEDGMLAALKETVAPPSKLNSEVSPEVDAIVLKALSRNRDERFATALEMARAIEKAAVGQIWHPEHTAVLVSKHFAERRQETRRLLDASSYNEGSGEVRIDSLMARVKASQSDPPKISPGPAAAVIPPGSIPSPTPMTSPPSPKPAASPSGPIASAPSAPKSAKRADAIGTAGEKISIAPVRPKLDEAKPINLTGATPIAGMYGTELDDDDSEAKTIPAAVLPEDLKALRKRAQNRPEASKPATAAPRQPTTEPGPVPAFVPTQVKQPSHAPRVKTVSDRAPVGPTLFPSGEVESVTSRGADAARATDFDEDGQTTVAAPEWVQNKSVKRTKRYSKNRGVRRRNLLIAIIVVSVLIAIVSVVLFLLDAATSRIPRAVGTSDETSLVAPKR